jgi:hypothetical protein
VSALQELGGLLSFRDRVEESKQAVDAGHFERLANTLRDTNQAKGASIFLAVDVGPYECADASGIDEGNGGEVKNEGARAVGAHCGLKAEQIGQYEGAGEPKDPNIRTRARSIFNLKGFRRHAQNGNGSQRGRLLTLR